MQLKKIFNHVLFKNFTSLSILQISNYAFPIITFPYLVRVLGPEKFGLVSFAAVSVAYFGVLIDYGFNLSAPREISIHRKDEAKISKIVSSVFTIKIFFAALSSFVLYFVVGSFDRLTMNEELYYLSFIAVIGHSLFPLWFFQGIEKMYVITIINVITRAIATVSIFILVVTPDDILTLVFINGASALVIGVCGVIVLVYKFKVKLRIQPIQEIKEQLINGKEIFFSTVAISLYSITNPFLLGLIGGEIYVGFFVAADKIRAAVQGIFSIIGQTVYPRLAEIFNSSLDDGLRFTRRLIRGPGVVNGLLCLLMFIFAEEIVNLLLGEGYGQSVMVLRIIAFLPLIIFLSNIAGIQIMLNIGYKKQFSSLIMKAAVINLILSVILVPMFFEIGSAISVLLTEIFVTTAFVIFLHKKQIKLF